MYMKKLFRPSAASVLFFVFGLGMIVQSIVTRVTAHGGDIAKIHGCIRPITGLLRIVGANDTCGQNETAVDWDQNAGSGGSIGTFGGYTTDQLVDINLGHEPKQYRYFVGGNFSNAVVFDEVFFSDFTNANLTGTSWQQSDITSTNFTNADFTDATFDSTIDTDSNYSNATFTNAILSPQEEIEFHSVFQGSNFTGANFTGTIFGDVDNESEFTDTNFTNATFTDANLLGTTFTNATFTGATWSNTTCPDGTNSDDNGNTCVGHL